jgi:hypothetical protein
LKLEASYHQKRIWSLDKSGQDNINETSSSFNIPLIFSIDGKLNIDLLEKSFIYLINRHEELRTNII